MKTRLIIVLVVVLSVVYGRTAEAAFHDFSGKWEGEYSSNRVKKMEITFKLKKKSKKKFTGTWNTSEGAFGDCTVKYNKNGVPKLKVTEIYPCDGSFKGKITNYSEQFSAFWYELHGSDCDGNVKAEGWAYLK